MKNKKNMAIPVQSYTRTVGYYAPISQTNPGKKAEIGDRKLAHVNGGEWMTRKIEPKSEKILV